jgi:hypothetical protein
MLSKWLQKLRGDSGAPTTTEPVTAPEPPSMPAEPAEPDMSGEDTTESGDEPA